jgi:hypothetical protein
MIVPHQTWTFAVALFGEFLFQAVAFSLHEIGIVFDAEAGRETCCRLLRTVRNRTAFVESGRFGAKTGRGVCGKALIFRCLSDSPVWRIRCIFPGDGYSTA